ncbi:hypothetical protein N7454_001188 [Penicillium verhagenii]|uniref:uncharacterized protein n=1 Tax=Penicillium verhagenii TaxID=1562060 RepID=UPI0025457465|nr:uncharacterized protein N7466_004347 [Penicillium verhagenii]KAJ5934800.1 hypothetical protein N7466_004347 [Penicillium verhagenii]KAJ5949604.1 hypothetical protein N7454_001188 [Penicillium verhagenii]
MPTPLDRAMNSKNLFMGFAGMVTAVAAYSIWGTDVFPSEADPKGDPEDWTADEMRRWLRVRGLLPTDNATREELLERVKANLRIPRNSKPPVSQS